MNINERISALRKEMANEKIDAYIIPSSDPHNSEYVAEHWKSREWISGFTGSAGVVVITKDHAGLWTDSRYFLQAEDELSISEFELHKVVNQFKPQHITWLLERLDEEDTIGFDGKCLTISQVAYLEKNGREKRLKINLEKDLVAAIWKERPELPSKQIFEHPLKFSGMSIKDKLEKIRARMKEEKVENHLVTTLDDIAWIYNIRGFDVEYNPVCIAYTLISEEKNILFIDERKVSDEMKAYFKSNSVDLKGYDEINLELSKISTSSSLLLDPHQCNAQLAKSIHCEVKKQQTISRMLKAVKNETEIKNFKVAMVKDGVALANTFYWLEQTLEEKGVSEFELSNKLDEFRSKEEYFSGVSFPAIVGYKENGAVIHYRPMENEAKVIENNGVLLCDSGGQYQDGTTDITRTFCFSEPSLEFMKRYTAVLKGMIDLTLAKFPKGTTGGQLDVLARKHLWAQGVNYLHGTGHGVGFFLNVHEAPQGFAPGSNQRSQTSHIPGMVSSNEPGYYKDGEYGIRIENVLLTVDLGNGFFGHETLTLFPIETKMIIKQELEQQHIQWLNAYHKEVEHTLSPLLGEKQQEWLQSKCKSI